MYITNPRLHSKIRKQRKQKYDVRVLDDEIHLTHHQLRLLSKGANF